MPPCSEYNDRLHDRVDLATHLSTPQWRVPSRPTWARGTRRTPTTSPTVLLQSSPTCAHRIADW